MATARMLMLAGIFSAGFPCMATAAAPVHDGYLVDSDGNIVKSGFGVCWHTGYWTPSMAVAECDSVVVKAPLAIKTEEKPAPSTIKTPLALPAPPSPTSTFEKIHLPEINSSVTAHFNFDELMLKPETIMLLDNLVRELNGASYEVIHVRGHADRIGSIDYNMGLSLRRANEVQHYLISKGIPAERIKTEGKGETQPVTKSSDCMSMMRIRTIDCLQPDRRTEITVVGTIEDTVRHK